MKHSILLRTPSVLRGAGWKSSFLLCTPAVFRDAGHGWKSSRLPRTPVVFRDAGRPSSLTIWAWEKQWREMSGMKIQLGVGGVGGDGGGGGRGWENFTHQQERWARYFRKVKSQNGRLDMLISEGNLQCCRFGPFLSLPFKRLDSDPNNIFFSLKLYWFYC